MALVADVQLPTADPDAPAGTVGTIWIAADDPPPRSQAWPLSVPIPDGWHEVSYRDALALLTPQAVTISFGTTASFTSLESEAAALSTAGPSREVIAARSLSRVPREPRLPRSPRAARSPRLARTARPARAPRSPRKARPPRRARAIRPIRKPRPKTYKTKQSVGICKGPSCTCWTPAGCVGDWYLEALPSFASSDCFRGPCYSYEACASDKCQIHVACAINDILQFWARQYRAAVAYVAPVAESALLQIQSTLRPRPAFGLPAGELAGASPLPFGAVTDGCPAGWYWTIGLTGARCVAPDSGLPPASQAQVIAVIGQAAWDALVGAGVQGGTA